MKTDSFFRHFNINVQTFAHFVLNSAEILHFVHHVTDSSVFIYVDEQYVDDAIYLLMSHKFAKCYETGIDSDNDTWIEIFF